MTDFIYKKLENQLNEKLAEKQYVKTQYQFSPNSFGSKFTIWKNLKQKKAIRLLFDGKESAVSIEETHFVLNKNPEAWANIVYVSLRCIDTKKEAENFILKLMAEITFYE